MKNKSWLVFLGIGIFILSQGVISLIKVPILFDASDLRWLTSDPDVVDHIVWQSRVLGVWQLGFGFLVIVLAVTGYRQHQSTAWWEMWCVPLLLLGVTAVMFWVIPITGVLVLLVVVVQFWSRHSFFQSRASKLED